MSQVDADLAAQANFARNLNVYAVATRYPEFGERIDGETAELLIDLTERAWALFEPRITALCVPEDGAEPLAPESDDDPAPRGGTP